MIQTKLRPPLALLAAGSLLASCATRPTAPELSDAIRQAALSDPSINLSDEEASCIASALLASDLSDVTLEGLASNFGKPKVLAAEQDRVEPLVSEAAVGCAQ